MRAWILLLMLAAGWAPTARSADWYVYHATAMTTAIEVELWNDTEEQARHLAEKVFAEFDRIEALMSSYRDTSEVSLLNRLAAAGPVKVSAELFKLLEKSQAISALSDGAFDMTFASVGVLYDYRNKQRPDPQVLAQAAQLIDYRRVILDRDNLQVSFQQAGMRVDLGGIAKGYAVDRGLAILIAAGIQQARVSAGGDLRLLGDRRGKPWIMGIRDPRPGITEAERNTAQDAAQNAVLLPLENVAVSTSGDYERFFMDGDERVHHILSPGSGKPASTVQSVTIIGSDATTTDGLSTAVFVMGVERGLGLINHLAGMDAIIIDQHHKLHYSDGLGVPAENPGPKQ